MNIIRRTRPEEGTSPNLHYIVLNLNISKKYLQTCALTQRKLNVEFEGAIMINAWIEIDECYQCTCDECTQKQLSEIDWEDLDDNEPKADIFDVDLWMDRKLERVERFARI